MTTVYFDIQIGTEVQSIDDEGQDIADVEVARLEAATIACELAQDMIKCKKLANMSVLARDELGELLVVKLEMQMRRLN